MKNLVFMMMIVVVGLACGSVAEMVQDFEGYADTAALTNDLVAAAQTANASVTLGVADGVDGSQAMIFTGNNGQSPWYSTVRLDVEDFSLDGFGSVDFQIKGVAGNSGENFKVVLHDQWGGTIIMGSQVNAATLSTNAFETYSIPVSTNASVAAISFVFEVGYYGMASIVVDKIETSLEPIIPPAIPVTFEDFEDSADLNTYIVDSTANAAVTLGTSNGMSRTQAMIFSGTNNVSPHYAIARLDVVDFSVDDVVSVNCKVKSLGGSREKFKVQLIDSYGSTLAAGPSVSTADITQGGFDTYSVDVSAVSGTVSAINFVFDADNYGPGTPLVIDNIQADAGPVDFNLSGLTKSKLAAANIFSDHMVLQREQEIAVWGFGEVGETVTAFLGVNEISTTVDTNGQWRVSLPAMDAGGSYDLIIQSGDEEVVVSDVMIGDVWIASGQSNMEWKLGWEVDNWEAEVADSDYPEIRFFKVNTRVLLEPTNNITGAGWKLASTNTSPDFSAVAWFFAKTSHLEQGVPVGIIESCVGGTPAEAWTPAEELLEIDFYSDTVSDMMTNRSEWADRLIAAATNDVLKWEIIGGTAGEDAGAHLAAYDDSGWSTIQVPFEQTLPDIVWLRKEVVLSSAPASAQLSFGDITQSGRIYVNGQLVAEKSSEESTAVISLASGVLQSGTNMIALRAANGWDDQVNVGSAGQVWLATDGTTNDLSGLWKYSNMLEPDVPEVERTSWWCSGLYNAMIHPLTGVSMKGVIWYQGESNLDRPYAYGELFAGTINGWRSNWGIGNFAFLFAQLSSYGPQVAEPAESSWAVLREQQTKTLKLPETGMAVTIDIGDAESIHPKNKQEVGRRLWLAAKTVVYGSTTNFSGPVFKSFAAAGSSLNLNFTCNSALQISGGSLLGFAVAGGDGVYYNAAASITGSNTVAVSSVSVSEPVSVRYGWADNSPANLYDGYAVAAVPFRAGEDIVMELSATGLSLTIDAAQLSLTGTNYLQAATNLITGDWTTIDFSTGVKTDSWIVQPLSDEIQFYRVLSVP